MRVAAARDEHYYDALRRVGAQIPAAQVPPHSPFGRVASRLSEQFDLILERHTLGETCEVWLLKFDEHLLLALVPDSDSATIAESVFERWPALLFVTVGSSHMLVARELSLADPSQRLLLARLFQEPSNN